MGEIKTNDLQEVKKPEVDNYQSIKPETDMKVHEARNIWDSVFGNDTNGNGSEGTEKGKENETKDIPNEDKDQWNISGEIKETGNEFIDRGEMDRFSEEDSLLQKLASGELDGLVGSIIFTPGGSSVWTEIEKGNPVRYKQGPGGKYFDGKENIKYEGKKYIQEKWETDNEKLAFLQKYGWLIEDNDVKAYSAKFKSEN